MPVELHLQQLRNWKLLSPNDSVAQRREVLQDCMTITKSPPSPFESLAPSVVAFWKAENCTTRRQSKLAKFSNLGIKSEVDLVTWVQLSIGDYHLKPKLTDVKAQFSTALLGRITFISCSRLNSPHGVALWEEAEPQYEVTDLKIHLSIFNHHFYQSIHSASC